MENGVPAFVNVSARVANRSVPEIGILPATNRARIIRWKCGGGGGRWASLGLRWRRGRGRAVRWWTHWRSGERLRVSEVNDRLGGNRDGNRGRATTSLFARAGSPTGNFGDVTGRGGTGVVSYILGRGAVDEAIFLAVGGGNFIGE